MSLEADIFTTLKGLVSNRCYPDVRDRKVATVPYIVWQQVGGEAFSFMESAAVGKRNARIQVACWDNGTGARLDVNALARAAEDALVTSTTLRATPLGAFLADYEEETQMYGTRQDFSIFY